MIVFSCQRQGKEVILVSGDLRRILKALDDQGFDAKPSKKGHWIVRDADGKRVTTLAGTASDHRAWLNALSYLRKAGFIWPPAK
jgi:hypothetical protein